MKLSRRSGTAVAMAAVVVTGSVVAGVATAEDTPAPTVRLIVGFKPGAGAPAQNHRLTASGARLTAGRALRSLNARSVTVSSRDPQRAVAALRNDPAVAFVEVDRKITADDPGGEVTTNDPAYGEQRELSPIGLPTAWKTTTGSAAVTVAVVDTGVSAVGDLTGAVLPGWDFVEGDDDAADDNGHGTSVAAIIAGRGDNGTGIAGACWKCRVLPVKVLDKHGSGFDSTIADGITYAADHGAAIINLSMGAPDHSTVLQLATDYARGRGALVVAAAGNDARPGPAYPAANAGVLAAGGTDEANNRYSRFDPELGVDVGSNFGTDWVDVAAPYCATTLNLTGFANDTDGTDVGNDNYTARCDASVTAPLVSGVAALVKANNPRATPWALEQSLTSTAVALKGDWVRHGLVQAPPALSAVERTAPKITGATPAPWARFRGAVTATATGVSDAGGAGLERAFLYADGRYVGADTTVPYAVRYHSGTRNGLVKLQWKVFDRAGNTTLFNRNVMADNLAPTLKITQAPANGAKVKGKVKVTATATDAGGVSRVELLVNGRVVAKDWAAGYTFTVDVARYGKKPKVLLRAVDRVGNVRSSAARTWKR